jgi:hypothetical protein
MYIETKNGYTHLTAHEGRVLSNERIGVVSKDIYLSPSMNANDWKEVSEFVLLTPQEQQNRLSELENKLAEAKAMTEDLSNAQNLL